MARKVEEITQHAHPKIFTLMMILKDIQNAKDILLRIQMIIERYQDGIIDLMTSTDTVSELLNIGWRSMKDNELNSDHLIVN